MSCVKLGFADVIGALVTRKLSADPPAAAPPATAPPAAAPPAGPAAGPAAAPPPPSLLQQQPILLWSNLFFRIKRTS